MVRKGARSSLRRELTRRVAFVSQGRILLSPFHPFVSPTLSLSMTKRAINRTRKAETEYASRTRIHKKARAIVPRIQKENRKHYPPISLRWRFPSSSIFKERTDKTKSVASPRCFIFASYLLASASFLKMARKSISSIISSLHQQTLDILYFANQLKLYTRIFYTFQIILSPSVLKISIINISSLAPVTNYLSI